MEWKFGFVQTKEKSSSSGIKNIAGLCKPEGFFLLIYCSDFYETILELRSANKSNIDKSHSRKSKCCVTELFCERERRELFRRKLPRRVLALAWWNEPCAAYCFRFVEEARENIFLSIISCLGNVFGNFALLSAHKVPRSRRAFGDITLAR